MNEIKFILNKKEEVITVNPTKRLLDVLREDFNLTGSKEGCGEGGCGACSVLMDNKIINSCITPIGNVVGHEIMTIEKFSLTDRGKTLKKSFKENGSVQCGICTPGMIIAAEALLNKNPNPTEEEIKEGLSGNLCRCTGYNMIIKAIKAVADEKKV